MSKMPQAVTVNPPLHHNARDRSRFVSLLLLLPMVIVAGASISGIAISNSASSALQKTEAIDVQLANVREHLRDVAISGTAFLISHAADDAAALTTAGQQVDVELAALKSSPDLSSSEEAALTVVLRAWRVTNDARLAVLASGADNASAVGVLLRPVVEDQLNTSLTEVAAQLTTLAALNAADVGARQHQRDTTQTASALAIAVAIMIGFVAALWLLRQLKERQQTVRRRERRLSALVEHASDGILVIDGGARVAFVTPSFSEEFFDDSAGANNFHAMVHPDDRDDASKAWQRVMSGGGGTVSEVEARLLRLDGEWRHAWLKLTNHLDDPAVDGIVLNVSDDTERLAAERRLLSLNRMHAVLSETGNAMVRASDHMQLLSEVSRILVETGEFAAAAFTTPASVEDEVLIVVERHGPAFNGSAADMTAAVMSGERAGDLPSDRVPAVQRVALTIGPSQKSSNVLLFPVVRREGLPGVLAVCAAPGGSLVTHEEERLLAGMVRDVAFALDSLSIDRDRSEAMDLSLRRAQQQSIVAELGVIALGIADAADVVSAAVASVVSTGLRRVTMFEPIVGGDQLLVAAVAGGDAPVARGDRIARCLVPMTDGVLTSGKSVTVNDFSRDPRYTRLETPFVSVGSGISVPILVGGEAVAALTVHDYAADNFDSHDVHFYESVAHVISGSMERSRHELSLRHDALHDRLTGLPNRQLLQDRLTQALFRRRRRQSGPLAVLLADLDGLRGVNEGLGREVGDGLLALVGARLCEAVRPSDTVARLEGDEFVVLCEDLVDAGEAATVAQRLIDRVGDVFLVDGREVSITLSIGIAACSDEATVEGLLRDADQAMQRAKETGRGKYELVDDALRSRLAHRLEIEDGLRHALDREQLVVAYQPIVDLATGDIREAEALLRWTREDGTPVSPAEFIPIAEQTGMIAAIGAWVLSRACEDAVRWNGPLAGGSAVGVAVNLSARQISDQELVPTVMRVLETTGLAPDLLRLEITETALMEEGSGAAATLQALDDLGVRLSIDDFGTGYSSLMYLRRYPVRVLKVDRYFVAGLGKNSEDDAIVHAVIALAHSLGLSATAEGVETLEQLNHLRSLDCDSGQGFLWSKAVSFDAFVPLIQSIRASPGDPLDGPITLVPVPARVPDPDKRRRRVVLADDSSSDRGLLRIALEDSGRFIVVGEAANGEAAIALAAETQPELLVLDMSMTGMNGLEALGPIHRASPATVVVFLSGFLSGALAEAVTQAGAVAHFDKSLPIDSLVTRLTELSADSPPTLTRVRAG